MNEIIIVKPEKCIGCNACIRSCPSPEANLTKQLDNGRYTTMINPDKCIACGQCIKSCNHGARDYIDDTEECIAQMAKEKVTILASPALQTALPNKWRGVLDWFREKGCVILDVSFGADICTWAHLRTIDQGNMGNVITQQCAAVVKYIEIYQPKLVQNLSPIQSPAGCAAIYVKKYLRRTNPIAVISPCIAMKQEAEATELIDYSITIQKLMEYFKRNGINIAVDPDDSFEYKFDEPQGQLGSIYSRPGGLRDNLWTHQPDLNIASSDGVRRVFSEIKMYAKMPENKHPQVFDVLSCEHGCNMGPATGSAQSAFDIMATMRGIETAAKSRRKMTGMMGRGEDRLFKKFDEDLRVVDFLRNYKPTMPSPSPSAAQLQRIYEEMGMGAEEKRCYDCRACGYKTCRDMATAIYRGLNTPDNCIIHAKTILNERHSLLTKQHLRLTDITTECLDLSDQLKDDIAKITDSMTTIGKSTAATSERAAVVKELLENIVVFCSNNPTMDQSSVSQLISILETTISAFSALDDNVGITNEHSGMIHDSIDNIVSLVEKINDTLIKTDISDS